MRGKTPVWTSVPGGTAIAVALGGRLSSCTLAFSRHNEDRAAARITAEPVDTQEVPRR